MTSLAVPAPAPNTCDVVGVPYDEALARANVPDANRAYWRHWCGDYLAFCVNARQNATGVDAIGPYLDSLTAKKKQPWQCRQAEQAVRLYQSTIQAAKTPDKPADVRGPLPSDAAPNPGSSRTRDWDTVLEDLRTAISVKHYSRATLKNYTGWVRQFRVFVKSKDPMALQSSDAKAFLEYLAVVKGVSGSSQNLAFNSLLFLYKTVLNLPFENMADTLRAKRPKLVPTVLSMDECMRVLEELPQPYRLMAEIMYGCGLRLDEGARVRVQDVDLESGMLTVRNGKGQKDRAVSCRHAQ